MGNNLVTYVIADTIISSLGFTTEENLDAIQRYQTGIVMQQDKLIADEPILAATIDQERLTQLVKRFDLAAYTRLEQLFILAIRDVLEQTGLSLESADCGLILSTTKGNIDLLNSQTDQLDDRVFLWRMAERIASYFHAGSRVEVVSNACISGVSAMIVAKRLLENGIYKNVIVAGGDILSHFITSGFLSFKSISKNRCCPFDAGRDGLNLGEACGAVVMTSQNTVDGIILSGGAISNDANHISGPSRTGDGLYLAIRQAMHEANVTTGDISFVNTHGTATVYNDEMEVKAINLASLQDIFINSLKSYFGHTLGASGVIETIICMHELRKGVAFGTLGYATSGVSMPAVISSMHRDIPMRSCLKTASGFGGCNAAIVLSLPDFFKSNSTDEKNIYDTTTTVSIENSSINLNGEMVFISEEQEFASFIREAYKNLGENYMKFYKMDDLCKLGYVAAEHLLKGRTYNPEEIGILLANSASSLHTDIKHQVIIDKDGDAAASPAIFVYTLANVVAGEICIRHKIKGENTFFISREYDADKLGQYAQMILNKANLKMCIIGWCDLLRDQYKAVFKIIEKR